MNCFHCGAGLDDASDFCHQCGARVGDAVRAQAGSPEPPSLPPAEAVVLTQMAGPGLVADVARYAGFWRRVAAAALDGFVQTGFSFVVVMLVAAVVSYFNGTPDEGAAFGLLYLLAWIVVWLYYALMHSSSWQATLGKRAIGIKVTSLTGERIGFGRATGRFFASLLSTLILGIGYLLAAFTSRRQALHDMIAGTLVVSRNATPEDVARGLGQPKVSGAIIAVAVVVMLIPTVGIFAAITIPAYQDYTIRSQVAQGLSMAAEYKAAVAEAIASGLDYSAIDSDTIALPVAPASDYVSSIAVNSGAILIMYGGKAGASIQGQTVALVPGLSSDGNLIWICGYADVPAGVTALLQDHGDYTDVEARFLPSSCR